jgi:peptidoglycan-N-acetylglucosamine deacetylase
VVAERCCAISVDLDEIPCYAAIHGLQVPAAAQHAIYRRAVPRFADLFADEGVDATFFVIGRDAEDPSNHPPLRALRAAGHELGNHSLDHPYDLTRMDTAGIRRQVEGGEEAIARAAGVRPRGFRAPGYTVTDAVFRVLEERGYAYDSSVFPCPPYFGAKAAALAAIALRGRRSQSILDDPRVLGAPADPYRVGRPYWTRGDGMVELPIGVTRATTGRLPYIGTTLALAGEGGSRWLTRRIVGRPLVNLELHGIDLADAGDDGLAFLRPHQPDLRRPLAQKRAALRVAIGTLRDAGYRFVTLAEAARRLAPSAGAVAI